VVLKKNIMTMDKVQKPDTINSTPSEMSDNQFLKNDSARYRYAVLGIV
jgi:hypothetical protein